jgi:hypothetical protein
MASDVVGEDECSHAREGAGRGMSPGISPSTYNQASLTAIDLFTETSLTVCWYSNKAPPLYVYTYAHQRNLTVGHPLGLYIYMYIYMYM